MECSLIALVGIATAYGRPFIGHPLYCDGTYDLDAEPWIALPIDSDFVCGELAYLRFEDGSTLMARVMDAGPLGQYNVQGKPILADIPVHLAPFALSGSVELYRIGAQARCYKMAK